MNPPPYKVNVISKKNNAFVWDPEGFLVGSLPRLPLQNQFLGLPLRLMPEETTLLLSKGFYPKINIKTSSKSLKWYNDDNNKFKTLELAKQSKVWTWPETPQEEYKYKIYCDLWNKGYFISSGLKFGALVMETNKSITPLDIITFGRLATNVKKSFMVCGWDEKEQKSIYHCIEWSGFGSTLTHHWAIQACSAVTGENIFWNVEDNSIT
ncbi:5997_t:CDS:2 [Entrophospora sp. SA101]|nr:5997_t:CDS:2 [Entrophospora sp. SA101]CAJ0837341.1 5011_t:CDS:2 [Entrophospora sp. SA101]